MPREILHNLIPPPGETDLTRAFDDLGKMLSEDEMPEAGVVKKPKDITTVPIDHTIVPPELVEHSGE